jgi:Papain family cysteine protease
VKAYFNLCGTQSGKLERFKEWLAFHGPILTRLKCDPSWNNIKEDGLLRKYDKKRAKGGHAVSIVGYTPAHFIIRNSWGTGWGHKGFASGPILPATRSGGTVGGRLGARADKAATGDLVVGREREPGREMVRRGRMANDS